MKFLHYTNLFLLAATAITWLLHFLPEETGRFWGEINEGAIGALAYYQAILGVALLIKYYKNRLLQLYVVGLTAFFVVVLPMSFSNNYFPWHLPLALAVLFTYILYTETKKRIHESK